MTDEPKWQKDARLRREKKAAAMAMLPPLSLGKESWWASSNDEYFTSKEATREAAVQVGTDECGDDGFYITCAKTDPVDIAAHFDLDRFIEDIDCSGDYLGDSGLETVFDQCCQDQLDDLESRIRMTLRTWQVELQAQGVEIVGDLFTSQHGEEHIKGATK